MNEGMVKKYFMNKGRPKIERDSFEVIDSVYYILPKEVKDKFYRMINVRPDFALIPNSIGEQGRKRFLNDGKYILFEVLEQNSELVSKVIKLDKSKFYTRDRSVKRDDEKVYWDTLEVNGLFKGNEFVFYFKT